MQIVVALVTALSRTETADGRAGSSLALGVLVPMFGLGLNGLWAAYHATFPPIPEQPAADAGTGTLHRTTARRTVRSARM